MGTVRSREEIVEVPEQEVALSGYEGSVVSGVQCETQYEVSFGQFGEFTV